MYAFDVSDKRLSNLKKRLKRSGASNIAMQRINNENDIKIKRLRNKFDRVLVDAPCSGLGTLRILEAIRILKLQKKTKFYQAST